MLFPLLCFLLTPALYPQTDFTIGAGDLLEITVLGVEEFSRELRVNAGGSIPMPFLGEIQVQGLTPAEVEEKLAGLLEPEYVKDPQVSVLVKEPLSRTFSVIGAVMKPAQYQIVQPITLVAAIAGAGGLDFTKAGENAIIKRTYDSSDTPYQIEVNLKKLLLENDTTLDLPIMPGDVINIPVREQESIYVIGDVTRPGPFDYPAELGVTVSRAFAMAGGPTKTSKLKDSVLIHLNPDGTMDRTELDLGKVLKGKLADIAMQPNDMLFIPGSLSKSIGQSLLQQLPYMVTWGLLPF